MRAFEPGDLVMLSHSCRSVHRTADLSKCVNVQTTEIMTVTQCVQEYVTVHHPKHGFIDFSAKYLKDATK